MGANRIELSGSIDTIRDRQTQHVGYGPELDWAGFALPLPVLRGLRTRLPSIDPVFMTTRTNERTGLPDCDVKRQALGELAEIEIARVRARST